MENILALTIGAMIVNNIVLVQFLGICPFLGVSKRIETALGMGAAVLFVMVLATLVTSLVHHGLLIPFNLIFLQTLVFILVIAGLVQMVEIILKKTSPSLYQALGVYLPLITTNCAILGVAILVVRKNLDLFPSIIYAVFTSFGFILALFIFAGLREKLEYSNIPKAFRGAPISLITAGLLALAFMGFSGMVKTV
jgi:electron transport complex protein RnfA